MDVPIDIETQVVIAQVVSLVVATLKEEDIFVSLKALILVGHDDRVMRRFPRATVQKWWLSNSLRLTEGLGTVAVSFYFIVQSGRESERCTKMLVNVLVLTIFSPPHKRQRA